MISHRAALFRGNTERISRIYSEQYVPLTERYPEMPCVSAHTFSSLLYGTHETFYDDESFTGFTEYITLYLFRYLKDRDAMEELLMYLTNYYSPGDSDSLDIRRADEIIAHTVESQSELQRIMAEKGYSTDIRTQVSAVSETHNHSNLLDTMVRFNAEDHRMFLYTLQKDYNIIVIPALDIVII